MKSVEITFRNKKDQTLVLALVDRLKAEVVKKQKSKKQRNKLPQRDCQRGRTIDEKPC